MATSASSYSVGNRVYRGGSSAPTQGTVDPMGYIDRELNKPSQRRSGIAAAALRRMGGPGGSPAQRAQASPSNPAYGINTNTAQSGQARGLGEGTPIGPAQPALNVDGIGRLSPRDLLASEGGTALPFDPEAADAQQGLLAQKNRFESDFLKSQQDLEKDYTVQRRTVEDQMPDARRNLLENYAGRGLAYSSGYTHDYGDLESQYANLLSQLESGKTEGIADLLRQRGLFNDEWGARLQAIQAAAARRLAGQAGELGLNDGANPLDALFPDQAGPVGAGDPRPDPSLPPGAPVSTPTVPSILNTNLPGSRQREFYEARQAAAIPQATAPTPSAQPAPVPAPAPAPTTTRTHERTMASFDPKSRATLSQGGIIVGGNGLRYKYDPNTGMAVPL